MRQSLFLFSIVCRSDILYTVKKLIKKWKLEKSSPFLKRPEKPVLTFREPNRRIGAGGGLLENDLDPTTFHLNWTPLSVMIK
jgi:hypothetical protein